MDKTTVIICHHYGKLIDKCLASLPLGANVLIASSTRKVFPVGISLYFPRNEPTYKRNYATYFSDTKYLCFLDDDIELTPNCIEEMEKYLDNNADTGMVYAFLLTDNDAVDTSGSYLSPTGFLIEHYDVPLCPVPILSAKSACCMIRRTLFKRIGEFDEDFVIYGEETDLSWRVWLAGYKVSMLPQAQAYHALGKKNLKYYQKRYIHYHGCKNYITMLIKNLGARHLYLVFINASLWLIMGLSFLVINRQVSKWIFWGIAYNVKHFTYIWKKRKRIQYSRKFTDRQLWKYIFERVGIKYYYRRFWDYLGHQLHRKGT